MPVSGRSGVASPAWPRQPKFERERRVIADPTVTITAHTHQIRLVQDRPALATSDPFMHINRTLPQVSDLFVVTSEHRARLTPRPLTK
jgi:hypothetical protein